MIHGMIQALLGTGFLFFMTSLGAATVFFVPKGKKAGGSGMLMGFAGGVMAASSVWSLLIPSMELAGERLPVWLPGTVGAVLGAGALYLLERAAERRGHGGTEGLMMTAITLHNIPEGMAVGLACALAGEGELGAAAALALGIGIQNFPEGAAVALPMAEAGWGRGRAFLRGVLSGAVEPVFGLLAVAAAAGASALMPWLLGFAAGAMLWVTVKELLPETGGAPGTAAFLGGFLMMMVLDVVKL